MSVEGVEGETEIALPAAGAYIVKAGTRLPSDEIILSQTDKTRGCIATDAPLLFFASVLMSL